MRGFTLLELSIVLMIIGILSMGALNLLITGTNYTQIKSTEQTIEQIIDAIYGFVIIENRFPCADDDQDGIENCPNSSVGFLPWKDLGVGKYDVWGQQFHYVVDSSLISAPLNPNYTSSIKLFLKGDTEPIPLVPAIIWSAGKDFATSPRGGCETENTDGDTVFNLCKYVPGNDILKWPKWYVVVNRLIRSRQLP